MIRKDSLIFAVLLMTACTGPGAPQLRHSANDGEGPFIQNCKNVSSATKVNNYITNYYLSTWGSVFVEGTREQLMESFAEIAAAMGIPAGNPILNGSTWHGMLAERVNHLPVPPLPFCRPYDASAWEVSQVIEEILPLLGNGVLVSDKERGVFITNFVERHHSAARWRDGYEINVIDEGPGQSVVVILRTLYISRSHGVFNQAISVGHNEAWIMTQIAEGLKRRSP